MGLYLCSKELWAWCGVVWSAVVACWLLVVVVVVVVVVGCLGHC